MVCMIIGVICAVCGVGLRLFGTYAQLNLRSWYEAFVNNGIIGPGVMWLQVGNILIFAGIVLMVIGFLQSRTKRDSDEQDDEPDDDGEEIY